MEEERATVRVVGMQAGIDGLWYPYFRTEREVGDVRRLEVVVLHKRGTPSRMACRQEAMQLAERMGVPFEG